MYIERSGADELKPSEQTDESKGKDAFDRKLESYNKTENHLETKREPQSAAHRQI